MGEFNTHFLGVERLKVLDRRWILVELTCSDNWEGFVRFMIVNPRGQSEISQGSDCR
jgi:hypothetical protein